MKFTRMTLALACALAPALADAQQITGAGGTFPAPVYAKWGEAAKAAVGIELNYQAIGSGGGQTQITNRTVDFGASDSPMDAAKLASANLLQFPTVMGAIVPIINLPGIEANKVKLTGELLAQIYLGTITKWNDPKLVEMNAGLTLPNIAIAPVYRADASGTSFVFTSYLSAVDADWKSKVGVGQSVQWPAGNGARGNDGVAAQVKNTRGGIGYVENAFATTNHLTTTIMRNKAGQFVEPTMATFGAAASSADWAGATNFAVSLIDQAGAQSWPIVSTTFLLLPKDPKDAKRAADVLKWMDWSYTNGGQIATSLEYIPLPKDVQDRVRAAWRTLSVNGQPIYK